MSFCGAASLPKTRRVRSARLIRQLVRVAPPLFPNLFIPFLGPSLQVPAKGWSRTKKPCPRLGNTIDAPFLLSLPPLLRVYSNLLDLLCILLSICSKATHD